jgi:DNA-directed RNA polymerase specialized sigma24 family protein
MCTPRSAAVTIAEAARAGSADVPTSAVQDVRYVVTEHGTNQCPVDAPPDHSVVVEALQRLSPTSRQILVEAGIHRNTLQVIAARFGIPVSTVRVRLHYALRELRREVEVGRVVQTGESLGLPVDRPRRSASQHSTSNQAWPT